MRINHHRHTGRNIAIGSLIVAAGAGSAAYVLFKYSKGKENEYDKSSSENDDLKIVESAKDVLLNKIGATSLEIEKAEHMNKTAYDIAKDKGFSEEQFKMFVNQDRTREIDELVLNRKISNEVGTKVKEKIIQHTNSWNGNLC